MHEIDVYLSTLKAKRESVRKLYTAALKAWKEYTRENLFARDADKKDIDGFVFWGEEEKDWEPNTVIGYLSPLATFFGKYNPYLKPYILKKQRELKAYMKTTHKRVQIPIFDVAMKMIKAAEKLQHKLCLWLMTVEGMSNLCLANLLVRHIDFKQHTYEVPLDSGLKRGQLHNYTMKLIEKRIDEDNLNHNDRLIGVRQRTIQYWTKKYAKKINFKQWKDISPNKLRNLGKNDILRELFIREYEKGEKES